MGNNLLRVSHRWRSNSCTFDFRAHIIHDLRVHRKTRSRIVTRIRFYFLRAFFRASMPICVTVCLEIQMVFHVDSRLLQLKPNAFAIPAGRKLAAFDAGSRSF